MIPRSKLSSTVAALLLLAAGARIGTAQAAARATPASKPVVLFDGKSLNGWKPIETPQMALLPDGSVANQRGKGLLLYTERPVQGLHAGARLSPRGGERGGRRVPATAAGARDARCGGAERVRGEAGRGQAARVPRARALHAVDVPHRRDQPRRRGLDAPPRPDVAAPVRESRARRMEHAARGRRGPALHRVRQRREGERLLRPQGDRGIHRPGEPHARLLGALPQRARHATHRDERAEQRGRAGGDARPAARRSRC